MSEDRELRDLLESTQKRVRALEVTLADVERRRHLAEQRSNELEAELTGSKERVRQLEAAGGGALADELQRLQNRIGQLELNIKQADTMTPRLPTGGVCARCGGALVREVLVRADIAGAFSDPAVLLKNSRGSSRIFSSVCSRCGLAELNAEAPQLLAR